MVVNISPIDREAMDRAAKRQAQLAKPPGSLGKLEDISIRLAGITGQVCNELNTTRMIAFCADNGVVEEGVSCTPVEVTKSQSINMTRRKTGMSTLAKYYGCSVDVVDVGILTDTGCPDIINEKIRYGTTNIATGPAMTKEEAERAIAVGIRMAEKAKAEGVDVIGVGEMGIGNTTTSAAVLSVLTGASVEEVTGRGGGLLDDAFRHKKEVIQTAIERNRPDSTDPIDVLAKVGGLDIAAMTGAFLGAAANRLPAVVDGYISIVAALCACRINPLVKDYLFLSHASFEVGYRVAEKELGLSACLLLDMRLGEGSGCPIMFEIMKAACAVMCQMATFEEAAINDDYLEEIREADAFSVEEK